MFCSKVTENTYQITKNISGILFEGLWDIPNGVSINSFIVKGEKAAIIDGMWEPDSVHEIKKHLDDLEIAYEDVEYIIVNHMEPDHSSWLQCAKAINPNAKIVCNSKSEALLEAFYGIDENVMVIKDGDQIDLGNGHVLTSAFIPNVHWPDTMAMLDEKTGTFFCCDAFGSFGEVPEENYDDKLTEEEKIFYEEEAVRYYSNIVASFSMAVDKAIAKCDKLDIKIVAPGHGIVWREDPQRIIDDYRRYASYQKGPAKEEITLIWGSMYGMTKKGADRALAQLEREGIKVNVHQVPEDNWGEILSSVWDSTGVVLAMPTYEYKMFPPMAAALEEIGKKKAQGRLAFRLGSYGWSGGAQRELDSILEENKMNWDFIEPVEYKGSPREEDLELIDERIKELVAKVRQAVRA